MTILEGVPATGFLTKRGVVTGVQTPIGDIEAEYVVNCAGMWARQLGAKAGVNIPLQSAEHYYLITEKMPGLSASWPVLEDPASHGYFREEVGGLMVGLFEPICAPWKVGGVPEDFSFGEITPDWERMGQYVERAMARVPVSLETGIRKFFCGPESFTPDLQPCVGEAPELKNFFVAAGLNSIGILTGGGMGRVLAHWIINGRPDVDVTGFNIDRLHDYQANPEYRRTRTVESLGMVYQCHYPTRSMTTARGAKRSAVHDRLVARGAYFKDVSGWEGADWYAPSGEDSRGSAAVVGQAAVVRPTGEAEHQAVREGVIVMDMSFMAKFLVQGRDAGRLLNHISANNVDGAAGRHHVHPVAQRGRQARGGPHGHQARRRALLGGRVRHGAPARRDVDAPALRRRARVRDGRDVGLRAAQRAGAAVARADAVDHQRRHVERGVPVPRGARDRHRLRARSLRAHHLPGRAGLRAVHPLRAGGRTCTTASSRRARRWGCGTRA